MSETSNESGVERARAAWRTADSLTEIASAVARASATELRAAESLALEASVEVREPVPVRWSESEMSSTSEPARALATLRDAVSEKKVASADVLAPAWARAVKSETDVESAALRLDGTGPRLEVSLTEALSKADRRTNAFLLAASSSAELSKAARAELNGERLTLSETEAGSVVACASKRARELKSETAKVSDAGLVVDIDRATASEIEDVSDAARAKV